METTLFNRTGEPVAHVADDGESSIYLWNGRAIAYVHEDMVYGWNGKHFGWFVGGIVCDTRGSRIGFVRGKCPAMTHMEPTKPVKSVKSVKSVRSVPHVRPVIGTTNSDQDLKAFLEAGAIG